MAIDGIILVGADHHVVHVVEGGAASDAASASWVVDAAQVGRHAEGSIDLVRSR